MEKPRSYLRETDPVYCICERCDDIFAASALLVRATAGEEFPASRFCPSCRARLRAQSARLSKASPHSARRCLVCGCPLDDGHFFYCRSHLEQVCDDAGLLPEIDF